MSNSLENLIIAEEKAKKLFQEIENRNLIQSGIFESELNTSIYKLAYELFQIETYWHKAEINFNFYVFMTT